MQRQRYFLVSFLMGVLISIVVSYGAAIFNQRIGFALNHDWAVLRTHTYHNYFAALFCIMIIAGLLFDKIKGVMRYWAIILVLLVTYNIFFMVNGRSTQALYLIMLFLLCMLWRFKLGFLIGVVIFCVAIILLPMISSTVKMGIANAQSDLMAFTQGYRETSLGLRLTWYEETAKMVMNKPFLGYGTGSFTEAYQKYSAYSTGLLATENPHNDYIFFAIQLGVIGPCLLLFLLLAAVFQARHVDIVPRVIIYVFLASMMLASLVNSFFTDNITNAAFILILTALLGGSKQVAD
jgi:O-antigen ligase